MKATCFFSFVPEEEHHKAVLLNVIQQSILTPWTKAGTVLIKLRTFTIKCIRNLLTDSALASFVTLSVLSECLLNGGRRIKDQPPQHFVWHECVRT